ncbi:DnaD domain protein [Leuconostoc suionicum]|uniref:DnaD domain protein n=1 Tax=Leuconostoc suionicum TaxID=1511761 RepID=UPI001B8B75FF|nr:DnaD domain protein [Leuconostoc suionicum]MBS1007766.1 DnaD domain protein [Leuconostoc suionicum]
MAERRMLSKRVTDTDEFLDMPLSAQALYMHINMHADDDGFVSNVKTIIRMVGAREDDLKILIAKQFIFSFDSGVVVVRNWFIHNYIRKDRYHETLYSDEKQQLSIDETGNYSRGRPVVDQRLTEVRLGKDRLGKDRLDVVDAEETENDNDDKSKAYSALVNILEQNGFGTIGGIVSTDINKELDDFAEANNGDYREAYSVILQAIKISVGNGVCKFKYLWNVTRDWYQRKLFTLKDIEASEKKRDDEKSKSKQRGYSNKPQRVEPQMITEPVAESNVDASDVAKELAELKEMGLKTKLEE